MKLRPESREEEEEAGLDRTGAEALDVEEALEELESEELKPITIPVRAGAAGAEGAAAGAVRPVCPTTKLSCCGCCGCRATASAPTTILGAGGGAAGSPEKKVA